MVRVSLSSAETLVREAGEINQDLVAYSLINSSAKSYQNRLTHIRVIAYKVSVHCTQCTVYH